MLTKSDRITRRREFSRVFLVGRSSSDHGLRLCVLPNTLGRSRLGVAVSGRHGNAVQRNRVRRLCREAFRACRAELPAGHDYIMVPLAGAGMSVESFGRSLRELSARLTRKTAP